MKHKKYIWTPAVMLDNLKEFGAGLLGLTVLIALCISEVSV